MISKCCEMDLSIHSMDQYQASSSYDAPKSTVSSPQRQLMPSMPGVEFFKRQKRLGRFDLAASEEPNSQRPGELVEFGSLLPGR